MVLKRAALRAVKVSSAAADVVRPPRRGLVVLLYHRVGGGSGIQVDLPPELFARQMEILAEEDRAVSLDRALELVGGSTVPGRDPVAVTFDDGTADFVDTALPFLALFGIPATLYLATDHVERGIPFPHGGKPLSWWALRDALSTGLVTIGSHTHTHALLDRLPPGAVAAELERSIGLIGDRLGVLPDDFAYPKAVRGTPEAEAAVRARFRSAALGGGTPNAYGRTDPFRLSRSAVQVSDGLAWWRRKVNGGMALEDALRRMLNRRRYAETLR